RDGKAASRKTRHVRKWREHAASHKAASRKVRRGLSRMRAPASAQCSIIELRRMLGRFEDLWIVPVEDLRVVGVANEPEPLVASIRVARIPGARNRWNQVLVEVLFQINYVARQNDGPGLGQLHGYELAAGGMTGRAHNAHRTVIEEIEVALKADDVHLLGVGEVARNIIERVADIWPPGRLQLVVLGNEGGI